MSGKPIRELKGVGTALELKLTRLGILTLQDLLFHLPLRYQDRTHIRPMASLQPGDEGLLKVRCVWWMWLPGVAAVCCAVYRMVLGNSRYVFSFQCRAENALKPGLRIRAFGEVRPGSAGLEMIHPEYQLIVAGQSSPHSDQALTPVYPLTEGLTQPRLRNLIGQALEQLSQAELPDFCPLNYVDQVRCLS